jgi:HSP20 family molecular chaperone IbpA
MTKELSTRPSTGLGRFFDRDPFHKLQQQNGRSDREFLARMGRRALALGRFHPSLDVSETDEAIQIRVDLARHQTGRS